MKLKYIFSKTFILSFLLSLNLNAADIVVNGSGISGTYTTISAAISAANSGDVIIVSPQIMPYVETLNIDKDLTIHPSGNGNYISFEGDVNITVDFISQLTLIGFSSVLNVSSVPLSNVFTQFNDTTRNSLTTIDIIDSKFNYAFLNQPKTSSYCYYSSFAKLFMTHGDVIACQMTNLFVGKINCSYTSSTNYDYDCMEVFSSPTNNGFGGSLQPSECGLFSGNIAFGDVDTFSDTINIISNYISQLSVLTNDFPVDVRNNQINGAIGLYLLPNSAKGTSQIINNGPYASHLGGTNNPLASKVYLNLIYCSATNEYNFRDVAIRILNNYYSAQYNNPYVQLNEPYSIDYSLSNLTPVNNSIFSYNVSDAIGLQTSTNSNLDPLPELMFSIGPKANIYNNPNPSSEFLDLDLSPNTYGMYGGSFSQLNYIDSIPNYNNNGNYLPIPGFGSIGSNSRARITYLNLPTLIYDSSNIQIKAKAIHGK